MRANPVAARPLADSAQPAVTSGDSEAFSLSGLLSTLEPSSVTQPVNFTGLTDNRLWVESQRGFSWTDIY
jgi:hypothetical protein